MPVDKSFEKLWKDENKTSKYRIIWAPHHSIDKSGYGMSNFKEQYLFFLDFAKKHDEYSFIFKPHPSLRFMCISENFLTEHEYDNYINEWQSLSNATVYDKGNYFDIFKTSDVLITDSSSFLAEYFYSGKPIIYFQAQNRVGFNEFGEKIKKGFYQLNSVDELEEQLKEILINKNDSLKSLRKSIIQQEFYYPKNGVGKEIVSYLKKELNR